MIYLKLCKLYDIVVIIILLMYYNLLLNVLKECRNMKFKSKFVLDYVILLVIEIYILF